VSVNPIIVPLLTVAKKLNNYKANATAGGLWTDTTHFRVTVPTDKRWFLLGGHVKRDIAATINTEVYDSSDQKIGKLMDDASGTGLVTFPEADYFIGTPWILDAGEYIESVFSVAQGTSATHSCVVLEVNV